MSNPDEQKASSSSSSTSPAKSSSAAAGVNNVRLGRAGSGGGRLPSFKGKRDLSLGGMTAAARAKPHGAEKKKFVPNINVQRKVKKEAEAKKTDKPGAPKAPAAAAGGHGRGAGGARLADKVKAENAGAGAGRGRGRPELIQTMGSVFSDGLGIDGIKRKSGGGFGREAGDGSSQMERPILASREIKYDKEADDRRLHALLRDDFIDDLSAEGNYVPVQLPMVDTGKVFKEEEDEEAEELQKSRKGKKKLNVIDSDDEDEPQSGEVAKNKSVIKKGKSAVDTATELTFPDLVKTQKGDLFFIQLPDHLPGTVAARRGADTVQSGAAKCTLQDLPEGYLGKIRVRKSGKTQLQIGEDLLDVELGTQVGFLQDLVSIKANSDNPREVGEMTVMGHVKNRIILTPDWEQLFARQQVKGSEKS